MSKDKNVSKNPVLSDKTRVLVALTVKQRLIQTWQAYRRHYFFRAGALLIVLPLSVLSTQATTHSLAEIRLAGIPTSSSATSQQLTKDVQKKVSSYKLTVERTDKSKQQYSLADAGLSVDYKESAQAAIAAKEDGSWWRNIQWWRDRNLALKVKTNQAKLDNFIATKASQSFKPAKNAELSITNGQAVITNEADGTGSEIKGSKSTIINSAEFLRSQPLAQEKTILRPSITHQNLVANKQKADSILRSEVSFAVQGKTFIASPKDIGNWIAIKPNEAKKTAEVSINRQAVTNYLDMITADYKKPAHTALVAEENGTSVTLVPGENGTDIDNKTGLATDTADSLLAGRNFSRNLDIKDSTYDTITAQATDKWLAVDLNTKRVYAVEHQKIVQTFLTSAGAPATPTVTGKFSIYQKFTKQDMTGANADGSNYSQPNVEWINYFYKDYAVHGNYWKPDNYFGNINASHGCVGLKNSDAKWIYDWSAIGTPVRVYS